MSDTIKIHDGYTVRRCFLRRANFGKAYKYLFSAYSEEPSDHTKYDVYYNQDERKYFCCVMQQKDKSDATK